MAGWTKQETFQLTQIWGEESIQAQLEGCKRNKVVYNKFGDEMVKAGFQRTGVQYREKIKKIKVVYKKVKDKRRRTGERLYPIWDYFDAVDAILGNKHAIPSRQLLLTA